MNVSNCACLHKLLSKSNPTATLSDDHNDPPVRSAKLVTSSHYAPVRRHCALQHRATFFPICILPQQPGRNKGWTKSGFKATVLLSTPSVKACLFAVFFVCSGALMASLCCDSFFLEQEIKKQQTVFVHIGYIEKSAFAWLKSYLFCSFWNPWNSWECITSIVLCDSCCWWGISKQITVTKNILFFFNTYLSF